MTALRRSRGAAAGLVVLSALQGPAAGAAAAAGPIELDCLMEPHMIVKLGSPADGIISEIVVDRGDVVRRGDVVARLESRVEEAQVALARARAGNDTTVRSARARLDYQRRKRGRATQLQKQNVVAEAALDEAETEAEVAAIAVQEAELDLELARLELQRAEEVLDLRTVRSPVDAVVVDRQSAPGEFAHEQSTIVTLAQVDPLNVEVFVPLASYARIRVGMRADVRPEAPVGGRHEATVTVVDTVFDAASDTFGVRLALPNPDLALPAGLRCRVRFASD